MLVIQQYYLACSNNLNYSYLAKWDDFRRIDWITEIEFPELTLQRT